MFMSRSIQVRSLRSGNFVQAQEPPSRWLFPFEVAVVHGQRCMVYESCRSGERQVDITDCMADENHQVEG